MYDNETIDSLLDEVSRLCTEYLHKVQSEVYSELYDATYNDATYNDTTDEAIIEGMDDSLYYTEDGTVVDHDSIEEA